MRVGHRASVEVEGWGGVLEREVVQVQRQAVAESEIQSPSKLLFFLHIHPGQKFLSVSP